MWIPVVLVHCNYCVHTCAIWCSFLGLFFRVLLESVPHQYSQSSKIGRGTDTGCGVMIAAYPCPPGTLCHTFLPVKLLIFPFIVNKFIISNFVLHNPVHNLKCKYGFKFLDEMTCPANMTRSITSNRSMWWFTIFLARLSVCRFQGFNVESYHK